MYDSEKLKALRGKLSEKRAKLKDVFDEAGEANDMSKVTVLEGDSTAKVDQIRAMNDEIDSIAKELEPLEEAEASITRARREAEQFTEGRKGHPLPPAGPAVGERQPGAGEGAWRPGARVRRRRRARGSGG